MGGACGTQKASVVDAGASAPGALPVFEGDETADHKSDVDALLAVKGGGTSARNKVDLLQPGGHDSVASSPGEEGTTLANSSAEEAGGESSASSAPQTRASSKEGSRADHSTGNIMHLRAGNNNTTTHNRTGALQEIGLGGSKSGSPSDDSDSLGGSISGPPRTLPTGARNDIATDAGTLLVGPGGASSSSSSQAQGKNFRSFQVLERIESRSRSSSKNSNTAAAAFGNSKNKLAPEGFGSYRSNSRSKLRTRPNGEVYSNYDGYLEKSQAASEDEGNASKQGNSKPSNRMPRNNAGTPLSSTDPMLGQSNYSRSEYAADRTLRGRLLYYGVDFAVAKKVANFVDMQADDRGGSTTAIPRVAGDQGNSLSFLWQCVEFAKLTPAEEDQALGRLSCYLGEEEFARLTRGQQQRLRELTGCTEADVIRENEERKRQKNFVPPPPLPGGIS
ncbi:unnamed protein product [Amoebophrya sp. A25]|nr:unnamed protein product [Amoebophrya sp. A25]|eukprot:GSA25T00003231001.1